MRKIKEFFWFCSGAHVPTLLKTPTEHNKYVSIGATIFFTGLFAAIAGAYALYFVFSGNSAAVFIAIVFGLIWGAAIFNLDRYIVSTIHKKATVLRQFLQATPRIILAILIGIVISRPLELKIFDKEIKEQLQINYLEIQRARIDSLNNTFISKYKEAFADLNRLRTERDVLLNGISEDRKKLNYEIFGNKTPETSGVVGYGPYAKRKEEALKEREKKEEQIAHRITQQENFINERRKFDGLLDEQLATSKQLDSLVALAGFADRNKALGQLQYDKNGQVNESNYWAITFIGLLFIFFECLPVFVKLMSAEGPYDDWIANKEAVSIYESSTDRAADIAVIDQVQQTKIAVKVTQEIDKLKNKA
ncbi:DUF4407 domain-containing protein [Olivibacter ginsenosidimutans]|uniref:DUF4407 domain-containing protein n=1 Tax=Olivibacter ginsenosidimutans TaxID=1176537 RepID=A0ABP9AMY4_9SPHI